MAALFALVIVPSSSSHEVVSRSRLEWFPNATKSVPAGRLSLSKLTGVVIGDASLATDVLFDDEAVDVFKLRGLSLIGTGAASSSSTAAQLIPADGKQGSKATPVKRHKLWSILDRGKAQRAAEAAGEVAQPIATSLLHVIAPSPADAAAWKAAFEVSPAFDVFATVHST